MAQALAALAPAAAVLMSYAGVAAPNEDKELVKDIQGMMEELVDALEVLRQLHVLMARESIGAQHGAAVAGAVGSNGLNGPGSNGKAATATAVEAAIGEGSVSVEREVSNAAVKDCRPADEEDVLCGQAGIGKNQGDSVRAATTCCESTVSEEFARPGSKVSVIGEKLTVAEWLAPVVLFMDIVCCYCGESEEVPLPVVGKFLAVASCFTAEARAAAAEAVQGQLKSSRMMGALLSSTAVTGQAGLPDGVSEQGCNGNVASSFWMGLTAELPQLLQLPSSRKRKRK
jgi:hypothetical protein